MIAIQDLKTLSNYTSRLLDNKKQELLFGFIDVDYNPLTRVTATTVYTETKPVEPKKPDVVEFHNSFVRINYKLYEIRTVEEGDVYNVFGQQFRVNKKQHDFIVKDGKVWFIKSDKFNNKYLSEKA